MNRIYDTSNTPQSCPTCGRDMKRIIRDGIRYFEADCNYSNIGGICEHDITEEETQEMIILNELAPGILRELRDSGSTAARDWIAAIVKNDPNGQGESAVRLFKTIVSINEVYGTQDADAIVRGIVHGMQEVI